MRSEARGEEIGRDEIGGACAGVEGAVRAGGSRPNQCEGPPFAQRYRERACRGLGTWYRKKGSGKADWVGCNSAAVKNGAAGWSVS